MIARCILIAALAICSVATASAAVLVCLCIPLPCTIAGMLHNQLVAANGAVSLQPCGAICTALTFYDIRTFHVCVCVLDEHSQTATLAFGGG
jgi:hypothetical protein